MREKEKYKIRYASDPEFRKKRSLQRGYLPMCESKKSAPYLGIYIAETALSRFFDHMERMPHNTPGYDFICGNGYKIDVKSSCLRHRQAKSDIWVFEISKNQIADYFLCLAFNNRDNLEPMHVWLIPGYLINHKVGIGIANTPVSLLKYASYEKPIGRVICCCDEMKTVATG